MENVIDLRPYLPVEAEPERPRQGFFSAVASIVESVVTVCIGIGFFIFLIAFFAVL